MIWCSYRKLATSSSPHAPHPNPQTRRRTPKPTWGAGALLATLLCAQRSHAAPEVPPRVQVVVASCESILPRDSFIAHAQVELLSSGVQSVDIVLPEQGTQGDGSGRLATIQIYYPECDELSGVINLRVSDRLTAKYVERSLFVGDVGREARARTLAVAAAELLRASFLELLVLHDKRDDAHWTEIQKRVASDLRESEPGVQEPSSVENQAAPAKPAAGLDIAEHWPRLRVEWIAGGRSFPEGGSGDVSSAISLSVPLSRRIRLHVGGLAAGGGGHADRNVHLFEGAGRVGLGVTGGNEIEIEVASVAELGWAKVSDQAGPDLGGLMSIYSLNALMRTRIVTGISVLIGVQGGYVLTPLVVQAGMQPNEPRTGFQGAMVGMLLGLSGTL